MWTTIKFKFTSLLDDMLVTARPRQLQGVSCFLVPDNNIGRVALSARTDKCINRSSAEARKWMDDTDV